MGGTDYFFTGGTSDDTKRLNEAMEIIDEEWIRFETVPTHEEALEQLKGYMRAVLRKLGLPLPRDIHPVEVNGRLTGVSGRTRCVSYLVKIVEETEGPDDDVPAYYVHLLRG